MGGGALAVKLMQIMTRDVETCNPKDSVVNAAKKMKAEDCGILPVVDDGQRVVGVVTDRDIVIRGLTSGMDLNDLTIADCMTTQVITASAEMDVHDAAAMMSDHQIRRLVVLDGDRLGGIFALGDMVLEEIHVDEAGQALTGISEPEHREGH
jgi:CBS domain-containing protein